MELFVVFQHLHKLLNAAFARLDLLGSLNPEEDGISIRAVQRREEGLGFCVAIQRGLEVGRYFGCFGRVIRGIPAPITFGTFNFLEPCIWPLAISFVALSRLILDQMLFADLGVKRCNQKCSLSACFWPSIHP